VTTVVNPLNFAITDVVAQSQSVTLISINVGTVSGGPYTAHSYPLTAAELAAGMAAGNFSGTLASIGENLPPGTYFAVATATNAAGTSAPSPEVSFQVLATPSPPTAFSVS
jgi:hypothetical protein